MKKRVEVFQIIRHTAGGFHAYCESNVGIIRKPLSYFREEKLIPKTFNSFNQGELNRQDKWNTWYQRLWNWLMGLFK